MNNTGGSVINDELLDDLLDGLEGFIKAEVIARHDRFEELLGDQRQTYDETGRFTPAVVEIIREIRQASASAGYFNMSVPEDMGGAGLGYRAYYEAWKRIYQTCKPQHWLSQFAISHWAFGPSVALEGLGPEARERVLPKLTDGSEIMSFGMSEPDAGSDAMSIRTTATQTDNGWLINGRKIWTSHAPIADWMLVLAITDSEAARARKGGISAFIVPTSAPGLDVQNVIRMWDSIGGNEGETAFTDVPVEPWQLVGELGKGFQVAMAGVSLGRVYNSARGVALGTWGLNLALDYSLERQSFGKPISSYQAVSHPLAESAAEIAAADSFARQTTRALDAGNPMRKEIAMMKFLAVRAGLNAVDRAMQTHGAIGFSNELGLVTAFKSLRMLRIADGTDEILLRTISNSMLKGDRFL